MDPVVVPVTDYERSKAFYLEALGPLGYVLLMDWREQRRAYLGLEGQPSSLWLVETPTFEPVDVAFPQALVDPDGNRLAGDADLRAA